MKNHSGCERQFVQLSKAWYADVSLRGSDIVDEIMIGFYHPKGGTTGEFAIRWTNLAGTPTPMLCSFDDSWSALWEFRDLLEKLSELDSSIPSPNEIVITLETLKIKDATQTKNPYSLYSKPNSAARFPKG